MKRYDALRCEMKLRAFCSAAIVLLDLFGVLARSTNAPQRISYCSDAFKRRVSKRIVVWACADIHCTLPGYSVRSRLGASSLEVFPFHTSFRNFSGIDCTLTCDYLFNLL